MTYISVDEFPNYSEEQLLEWLNIQDDRDYQVIIPRMVLVSKCEKDLVSDDYTMGAYWGEKLAAISAHFSYLLIDPRSPLPFIFAVNIDKPLRLARIVNRIIQSYDEESEKWEEHHFAAYNFLEDAATSGRKIMCQPLWDIAGELSKN